MFPHTKVLSESKIVRRMLRFTIETAVGGCEGRRCETAVASPFIFSLLGCSRLPLPPCLPSLSPFMISLPGCSWPAAPLSPKLVSLYDSPFLFAAATRSPTLFRFLISLLGYSWLLLVPLHDFPFWLPLPCCLPVCLLFKNALC